MKVIEILNLNKELLKNFRQAGIRIEDVGVLTPSGLEMFSNPPKEIIIL